VTGTGINPSLVVPSAEGHIDALKALKASCEAGKWTLLAPDGRIWMTSDLMLLFAVLAHTMKHDDLKFEPPRG